MLHKDYEKKTILETSASNSSGTVKVEVKVTILEDLSPAASANALDNIRYHADACMDDISQDHG